MDKDQRQSREEIKIESQFLQKGENRGQVKKKGK